MKTLALLLGLAFAPLPATAQQRVLPPVPITSPGITVTGHGLERAAVKTVQFTAMARGALDEATVLGALRAAGIDDPVIGPAGAQLFLAGNGPTTLRGTIHDVSRAKLEQIALAASAFIASHPGVSLDNVQFTARLDDCASIEQRARTSALDDAHRKAQGIAGSAGVALGDPVGVTESGGCPLTGEPGWITFDLGTLTATIQMNESVTYAIEPGGASRRRTL